MSLACMSKLAKVSYYKNLLRSVARDENYGEMESVLYSTSEIAPKNIWGDNDTYLIEP
jgi:hypothetical protein